MPKKADLREKIVDAAVALAEERSWEEVRLFDVAKVLGVGLNDVRAHFREKEDVIEGWFDRADAAVLDASAEPGFTELPARVRLHRLIMTWLEALAGHRRVTREMIYGRFEPGHVHMQARGLLRVSRTVQWIREGARRDAAFLTRALEETVLTSIYLATFFYWMNDDSTDSAATRRLLDRLLRAAEWLPSFMFVPERTVHHLGPVSGEDTEEEVPTSGSSSSAS
ncbi:TetR family transcriptional regulator [Thioalkalivibrio denitrificans]|uniref:TetR family transcriptional regulator n=1 Tax=Thioalkalivibrio denitrificans TaxID=108003 RepID=A0A1V3NJM2_9GAMM|nr:TetR/AcrR family transcriptional regulator [Thioalkalivibrio denitrificans]OOG25174.1 TetR family transcriptional regulator [Thioalkalivibrio denitrificans]